MVRDSEVAKQLQVIPLPISFSILAAHRNPPTFNLS